MDIGLSSITSGQRILRLPLIQNTPPYGIQDLKHRRESEDETETAGHLKDERTASSCRTMLRFGSPEIKCFEIELESWPVGKIVAGRVLLLSIHANNSKPILLIKGVDGKYPRNFQPANSAGAQRWAAELSGAPVVSNSIDDRDQHIWVQGSEKRVIIRDGPTTTPTSPDPVRGFPQPIKTRSVKLDRKQEWYSLPTPSGQLDNN